MTTRVIKSQKGDSQPSTPAAPATAPRFSGARVIEGEIYQAQKTAQEIRAKGEQDRKARLIEGKRQAALVQEETMSKAAAEAFAKAANEAIAIFQRRAKVYEDAAADIRVIALEIVQKILGTIQKLPPNQIDDVLKEGIKQLRARRCLRLQMCKEQKDKFSQNEQSLFGKITALPDFKIEEVADVKPGFIRVVTDVGSALCEEADAIKSLTKVLA